MRRTLKIKKLLNNIGYTICNRLQENAKQIIYLIVFICGVGITSLSFFIKNNWTNIYSGIGTGLLTSLVVSVIINAENNARENRKKEDEKRFVLNDIIRISIDIYEDIIYRINEFVTLTDVSDKSIYKLYDDFTTYNHFEEQIKAIDVGTASDEMRKRLNILFNFKMYRIEQLVAELKRLHKLEYFLRGVLTEEECNNLISNYAKDSYLEYAANIQEFWDDEIKDKDECIRFLRMTIYICSKTISCFLYSREKVKEKEKLTQERISQVYYYEVYSKSDEYIEKQLESRNRFF